MNVEREPDRVTDTSGALAGLAFAKIETLAYVVLGLLLALAALLGVGGAAITLWHAIVDAENAKLLIVAIDRMLFVLMIVEILHTVRVSFSAGEMRCEPILIVGLIASIRRVLVITLESSQVYQPEQWTPDTRALLHATLLELVVLSLLIMVLVISIYMLRRSKVR